LTKFFNNIGTYPCIKPDFATPRVYAADFASLGYNYSNTWGQNTKPVMLSLGGCVILILFTIPHLHWINYYGNKLWN